MSFLCGCWDLNLGYHACTASNSYPLVHLPSLRLHIILLRLSPPRVVHYSEMPFIFMAMAAAWMCPWPDKLIWNRVPITSANLRAWELSRMSQCKTSCVCCRLPLSSQNTLWHAWGPGVPQSTRPVSASKMTHVRLLKN